MLTLLMYAVCLLVILKGAEMLQFSMASVQPKENWRKWVTVIGVLGFIIGVIGGGALAAQWTAKALQVGRMLNP